MIRFPVAHLQRELRALDALAAQYMTRSSQGRLGALADSLDRIRRGGQPKAWEILETEPLETKVSEGAYQPGGSGRHHVYAHISWVWDVRPVDAKTVEVFDRATTRVTLYADDILGVLSVDLGEVNAPGCFFHVQVSGGSDTELPLPKDFDVPRFPTLVATPASVVEFVLSELFQTNWSNHASKHSSRTVWISSQRLWWNRYLDWQKAQVRAAGYSPWVELKRAIPDPDLFC